MKGRKSSPARTLLLRRLRLLLLFHLLRLHLLQHRGAAAGDLPHPDLEGQIAIFREAGRRVAIREREPLRHGEAVLAALLHPAHRLGEAGIDLLHREGLRTVVAVAAVEDGAVVAGQDIVHEGRVGAGDRLAGTGLDGPELQAAFRDDRSKRASANPGEANRGSDDQEESQPKRDRTPAPGGAMGGFSDGHLGLLGA